MDFTAFLAGASLTAGRIVVLDLNGNIKILAPGQAIAPGELVIETLEETDVPQFRIATDAGETNITDDIQQIFAALEEGQDPTQLGDDFATAAGETGGSSLVAGGTISRTGAESLASTDFSTQGLQALGLNEAQSLSLFDLLNDSNTTLQDIDSIAPSAPTVTLDTDSGSKADDFLTNDGSYTVTDIEDGAIVEYFVDGEWTTTEPVAVEGENTIIIRQTDEAGNSSESSTLTFTLDTTAPDAPQISLDTDSGSLVDDFLTNKGDFTVAGTEEGATVEYFVNGEWTTTAPTPVEGDNTIIVRQTDAAGNTSGSSTLTFTLDTTAPDAPQISLDIDSGSLADDFLTNKGDFTVAGTEEGATVEYFVNGEWTTTAPTPVEGDNTIIVRQTDAAGNTSGSSTLTFTLDTTAPDAPQISLDIDSGSLADDFLTNKGDFTVAGTEEGATVEYFVNGEWTTTAPTPVEGENTIIVRQTDAAGNTSGSSTLTFTLDTTAQAGTVSVGPITSDDVITETEKNQAITVTGSATGGDIKTGDIVTAIINGNEYKGSVSEDGSWELSVSGSDLAVDTAFEVTVNSTDAAGNEVTSKGESVHRLNDVPVAKDGTAETEENTVLTGNVPAAEDVDGTVESYQLVDDVAQGSLDFNADGSYTFTPGSDFDDLPAGDSREVTFTYSATDNNGGVSEPKTITITVTGTNDAPTATAATGSVTEDASITGSISAEDVDLPAGASLTFSTTSTAAGLTLNADGSYSFDASSYDSLKAGEEQVITIPVVVTDDQGATAETTLTITVTGTNDAPTATAATGSVTEDASITGSISAEDVDLPAGASLTFSTTSTAAGLTLNADGSYSFDASSYDSLKAGEEQVITIPVVVTDDQGATAETTLTITVTGTNDAPTATAATGSVTEDASITGSISAEDVDLPAGASLTFSTTSTAAGLTLNADGSYSFDASSYDSLKAGEEQVITIPVVVTDDQGATAETTLTITVTGTNDAPTATAATGSVTEDASITGSISAEDVDLPAGASLTFSTTSTAAGLTLNADGSYSFDASSYDSLKAGEEQVITIPVVVTDDQGATAETTLTITVTGTNDAPTATAATGSVTEDASITGSISAEDVDLPAGASLTFSTTSTAAGLTLNADGSYSFDASSYDSLKAGEEQVITIPVVVTDDQGATAETTLTITVTGTNDAPTATAATGSVTEDASITGSISAEDVDLPAGASLTFSTTSTAAGLTLNADGSYSFDASSYDSLKAGEEQVITIPVVVTDDQGATAETTLTITVTGTNDAPTATAATGSVTEDASITGSISAEDVDLPAGASLTFSTTSTAAGLTLNADGSYSFDASSYDSLKAGEEQVITIPVVVTDDQGATAETTLTITVTGTNDAPTATAATGSVTEDASITGSISAEDVDLPAGASLTFSTTSTAAGLTLNADGSYSFDASSYDSLKAGEEQVITIPVVVTDDQGATAETTLTITVTGTNDAPTATAATGSVTEDASITGSISAEDVDLPAGASLTFSTTSTAAGLTLNADGSYSFDASSYDSLKAGEEQVITIPVVVTDDQGATAETTLTITVTGTNDAPTATAATGSVTEDASITGSISAEDVDLPAGASLTFSTTSTAAGLTLNADGSYSFDASSYDSLKAGEEQVITIPVVVTDDQGATAETTLTITVTGTNDAPTATAATGSVTEDASITGSISAEDVDLPAGASLTFSTTSTAAGLTLNADGSYSFDASSYDSLKAGEEQVITIPVVVTDDQGATAETTLTITVTGTNDAPTATAATGSVTEDASITGSISAEDVDLPAGASLTFSTTSTAAGLTLNADGSYSFDASSYDSLKAGEEQVITIPVVVTDDQGATAETTLTITVTGTNDAPTATAATGSVTEDASITGSISAEDVDLPAGASLTFSTTSTAAGLTLNADGSYSFDASSYDSLKAGEEQVITIPVVVTDDQGATAETTLTITVTGTNDAPTATAATGSVTEDASITGSISAEDVDLPAGASLTFSTTSTAAGLTLNADGSYSFDASSYDSLKAGEEQVITIPVVVTDDQGATAETTLTITVTGTNDAPTATAATGSVTEDASITGSISAEDVDLPAGASLTFSTTSTAAGLTLNADGSYSFDASSYDSLKAGEEQVITIPVVVTDDQGATAETTLTITVTGTNDAPTATAATGSVTEDASITGSISAEDVDLPAGASLTFSTTSTAAGLTLNADGSYSFDASSYDSLKAGEEQVITIPVVVTDDQGATAETTLTITVTGTNDAPTATAATGSVTEDASITGSISAEDVDLPAGASLTFSTTSTAAGLTLNADGSYSFDASSYDSLKAGEEQVITIPVVVTDDQGATAETTLTITVTGTNDAPTATAATGSVTEDASITGSISAEDVDLPAGASLTFSTTSTAAGLTLNADGSYSFDASSYDSLKAGEEQVITIPVVVTDDQGATAETTLTITVTGTNDAPTATAATGSVTEDASITGSISAEDVDLPAGASLTFSTTSTAAGLTLNADGSYSFDASSYDSLKAGEEQVITIPVVVTDDQGATAETTLTINGDRHERCANSDSGDRQRDRRCEHHRQHQCRRRGSASGCELDVQHDVNGSRLDAECRRFLQLRCVVLRQLESR